MINRYNSPPNVPRRGKNPPRGGSADKMLGCCRAGRDYVETGGGKLERAGNTGGHHLSLGIVDGHGNGSLYREAIDSVGSHLGSFADFLHGGELADLAGELVDTATLTGEVGGLVALAS